MLLPLSAASEIGVEPLVAQGGVGDGRVAFGLQSATLDNPVKIGNVVTYNELASPAYPVSPHLHPGHLDTLSGRSQQGVREG